MPINRDGVLKVLLILAFLALMLGLGAYQAQASSINVFTMDFPTPNTGDSDLQFIASHYRLFIAGTSSYYDSKVQYLHQLNPGLVVIPYRNGTAISRNGSEYAYIDSNHPDWFLKDANGNRVYETNYPDSFVLDPSNLEWQQYAIARAQDSIGKYGYNGVYFDNMSDYIWVGSGGYSAQPINPATNQPYTDAEWKESVRQYLANLKKALGTDKLLIFNGIGTGYHYYKYGTGTLANEADGALVEGFMRWSGSPADYFKPEELWKQDVDLVAELNQKGKTGLIVTSVAGTTMTGEQKEQVHMYSLASYLLAEGDKSLYAFWPTTVDRYKYYDSRWSAQIGEPTGGYYKADGVYQRDFTEGKVLVNPDATIAFNIDLGSTYVTLSGQTVSTVTVAPHTGILLQKIQSPPNPTLEGAVVINGGNPLTNTGNVTLSLPVTATAGISQVMVSNDASFTGASWVPYSATKSWSLTSGDGGKTVYAKFKDQLGTVSAAYSDTIFLDSIAPSGVVSINAGAEYVADRRVTLTLSATDAAPSSGITYVMVSNDASFTGASWVPYSQTKSWWLTPGDGQKTVYYRIKDKAGNISSAYQDSIGLDTRAPTGSVTINWNAPFTLTRQVILTLTATDPVPASGVAHVMISNDSAFTGASWVPYATSKTWWLTSGPGTKEVYVKYKDKAGNVSSIVSDDILNVL